MFELRQPCLLDGRPGIIAGVVYGWPTGSRYDVLLANGEVIANAKAERIRTPTFRRVE